MTSTTLKVGAAACAALSLTLLIPEPAEARRGGSFGSRGARTYQAPPPTRTAPEQTAPVQRSMTPQNPAQAPAAARPAAPAAANAATAQRRGLFGGLGGGLLGGLLAGGLIGMLLGHGFGAGMAGFASLLFQLALVGLVVWLGMRLFRRRQPALAGHPAAAGWAPGSTARFEPAATPAGSTYAPLTPAGPGGPHEIAVTGEDREAFERLLHEVQDAFAREDYAALRERTTPEVMSYLAEELSQNATRGVRNEVSGTRLLEADVAEAWREGEAEYVTAAMRYESLDLMRDRGSGALVEGDPAQPTQATELWTFVRVAGAGWKLSAIQEA